MFYIERSCTGPMLCSDTHYCLGLKETGGLVWICDGSKALAFPTKEEAEAFCKSHKLSLDADKNGYEPRYVIVEELRLPEVSDIACNHGARFTTCYNESEKCSIPCIIWDGHNGFYIRIVRNTDVAASTHQDYEYVVGARFMQGDSKIFEEIHNPSYIQLDEFVKKCIEGSKQK